ncbi:hypothetical protein [Amycolatopsis sp. NPDC049159]|uniref:hypothetical protein n=1 Tax=Amycolatopsis sp. NPDC049159 TaxID=3157210 RepID=UPI0034102F0B
MATHLGGAASRASQPSSPKGSRIQATVTGFTIAAVLLALALFGTWHLPFLSALDDLDGLREDLSGWLLGALVPGTGRFLWVKVTPALETFKAYIGSKVGEWIEESKRSRARASTVVPMDEALPARIGSGTSDGNDPPEQDGTGLDPAVDARQPRPHEDPTKGLSGSPDD